MKVDDRENAGQYNGDAKDSQERRELSLTFLWVGGETIEIKYQICDGAINKRRHVGNFNNSIMSQTNVCSLI